VDTEEYSSTITELWLINAIYIYLFTIPLTIDFSYLIILLGHTIFVYPNHTCLVTPAMQFSIILSKYPGHVLSIIDKMISGGIELCSEYVTFIYYIELFTV